MDVLTYYPAMIVVSNVGENEFRARPRTRIEQAAEKNDAHLCTKTPRELQKQIVLHRA